MPLTLLDAMMSRPPTAERPLLGVMVLIVEDSRYSSEALRLICQKSGARIRRAESLASATRHLRAYRPRVAIVDLGLPDGSGLRLIEQLANTEPRIEALIGTSGDPTLSKAAMRAGADIFLSKPFSSIAAFQSTILSLLPPDSRPNHILQPLIDDVSPDPIALRDDLALIMELLKNEPSEDTFAYVGTLLQSLGQETGDPHLLGLASDFAARERSESDLLSAVAQIKDEFEPLNPAQSLSG